MPRDRAYPPGLIRFADLITANECAAGRYEGVVCLEGYVLTWKPQEVVAGKVTSIERELYTPGEYLALNKVYFAQGIILDGCRLFWNIARDGTRIASWEKIPLEAAAKLEKVPTPLGAIRPEPVTEALGAAEDHHEGIFTMD